MTGDAAGNPRDRSSTPPMPLPRLLPSSTRLRRAVTHGGTVLAAALMIACAGAGAPPESAAAAASGSRSDIVRRPDTPPRMLREGQPLQVVRAVPVPPGQPAPITTQPARLDLWYSVIVEADGRPNLSTLQIGGNDGRRNREAILQWISTATFAPALLDGVPVAAEFRGPR